MTFWKSQSYWTENKLVVFRTWGWEEGLTVKEGIENIWRQRSCFISCLLWCRCTAVHVCPNLQNCVPKRVNFTACKFCFNLHIFKMFTLLLYCLSQILWFSSVFYISDILTLKSLHVYRFFFLRYFAISNGSVFFLVTVPGSTA